MFKPQHGVYRNSLLAKGTLPNYFNVIIIMMLRGGGG